MPALVAILCLALIYDLSAGSVAAKLFALACGLATLVVWRRNRRTHRMRLAALVHSERRFRDFTDAGAHYVWEIGPDLRFTYVSDSIERVTGDKPRDIVGKTRTEVRPDDPFTEEGAQALERQVTANVPFVDVPIRRTTVDGRVLHLLTSGKPFFDHDGRYLGYRCSSRDVTQQVEAQRLLADSNQALQQTTEALAESERRFRDFANAASDWFWEQDKDHRFTFILLSDQLLANGRTGSSLGLTRREANPDGASKAEWDRHEADLNARRPFRDFRFRRDDDQGNPRFLSVNGVPMFDRDGLFIGYRGTGRDITAQVLAEQEAQEAHRARDLAEAASRAKSQFLAHISHELRTPLNAIIGFSEIMGREILGKIGTPKYREYATDIQDSARHLLELINDMLDMARIEVGKYRIEPAEVTVAELVGQVTAMTRGLAEQSGLAFDTKGANRHIRVLVDARAYKQVLLNLISNAIKFTAQGGRIDLHVEPSADGGLTVRIVDTGRGIPAAALPTLFEPFQQASAAQAREGGGSGLGLWISRNLMRLHGGDLTIASVEGRGTEATVTLPPDRILAPGAEAAKAVA